MLVVLALVARTAHADVPDPSLRAVVDRSVRLELDGSSVEGRVLGFDAVSVTVAAPGTNEVITVPRASLERVIAIDAATAPERRRIVGLHSSLLGTFAIDADYKMLHVFASTNVLMPVLTASSNSLWLTAAVGGGVSLPIGETGHWRFDAFAQVLPLHVTSYYTYLGLGVGAGFHYTAASGFSLGFTFPVIGFATRVGRSPSGYDAPFRYNDSIGYYYLAGIAGMPLVTLGYRFGTRCASPRSIANNSSTSRENAASSK
jgi:hypothetical protein